MKAIRLVPAVILWIYFLLITGCPALSQKRLALVIGNSQYTGNGETLNNPVNDANLMAQTLQSVGFTVIRRTNCTKQAMEQAFQQFASKLASAEVALFFYAGHGLQVNGVNYLVPTDATLNSETDVRWQAIKMNDLVEELERYPDKVNIIILDACRNNPYRSWGRSTGGRGFKAPSPSSGTIIAFATSEDATASDGTGMNGLFTQELVKQIVVPQSIESVFKHTRVEVQRQSNGQQVPQEWSKLNADFAFVEKKPAGDHVSSVTFPISQPDKITVNELKTENTRPTGAIGSPSSNKSCPGSITDSRDGKIYKTVQIGTQCWMAENLNVGILIESSQEQTNNGRIEKYCYDNNEANCNVYGGLYQWNELMQYDTAEGAKGLCPDGWHIPTDAEWSTLTAYLGGEKVAGGKMKEARTTHWRSPNKGASNSSGFTALPGGICFSNGNFFVLTDAAYFWSSSKCSTAIAAWGKLLGYNRETVGRHDYGRIDSFSARCLRD